MRRSTILILGCGVLVWLTGCSVTPEACDPHGDPSLFDKLGCAVSGSYAARVEQQRSRLQDLQTERDRLRALSAALQQEELLIRGEADERRAALERMQRQLRDLQEDLRRRRGERDALTAEINQLGDSLEDLKEDRGAEEERRRKLAEAQQRDRELAAALEALEF